MGEVQSVFDKIAKRLPYFGFYFIENLPYGFYVIPPYPSKKIKNLNFLQIEILIYFCRLGLERGSTAAEALQVITTLLEKYGQVKFFPTSLYFFIICKINFCMSDPLKINSFCKCI
jgi:hypothetical protein